MAKEKHYLTENTKLMAEWDWEKNEKSPDQYTLGSGQKVWWKCKTGHEWQAIIANRARGGSCPYCSGRCVTYGKNDLLTTYPKIAKEWHPTKNGELNPSQVGPKSNKKVWWLCNNGHEWQATIENRTDGKGCPYCSGRLVVSGINDLQTKNKELADEWNYEKNYPITPDKVMPGNNKKYWWTCKKCGFIWKASINSRSRGAGCPKCAKRFHSSFPEQAIYYYIRKPV